MVLILCVGTMASLAGCAAYPTGEDLEDLVKKMSRCGAPRIDPALTYSVLHAQAHLTSAYGSETPDAGMSASALLRESLHDVLGKELKLQVADSPESFPEPQLSLLWPYVGSRESPCEQRLAYKTTRENPHILIFARGWSAEGITPTEAIGGVLIGILVVGAVMGGAGGNLFSAKPPSSRAPGHIVIGMAEARTGQVFWVRTVLLLETDSLRSRHDVKRLIKEALDQREDNEQ
jgi:hypothetical protein